MITYNSFGPCTAAQAAALAAGLYEAEKEEIHRTTEQTKDVIQTTASYQTAITTNTNTKGAQRQ